MAMIMLFAIIVLTMDIEQEKKHSIAKKRNNAPVMEKLKRIAEPETNDPGKKKSTRIANPKTVKKKNTKQKGKKRK